MADIQLKQVAILSKENHETKTGGAHYHVFRNLKDGSKLIERTTVEQHNLQKGPGGAEHNPKKDGYEWVCTYGNYEYDTPSGRLEPNTYAIDGEKALVNTTEMEDGFAVSLPKTSVVDDKISDAMIPKELKKAVEVIIEP